MSFSINVSNNFASTAAKVIVSDGCSGTLQPWGDLIPPSGDINIPSPGDCTNIQLDSNPGCNWWIEICPPLEYECDPDDIIQVEENSNCLKIRLKPVELSWIITLKKPGDFTPSQPTNVTIGDN